MPSSPALTFTEGTLPFTIPSISQPCETWYRIYGSLEDTTLTPVVALHGGPGCTSDYISVLGAALSPRPVIIYDQVGNGNSTHLPSTKGDASLWTASLLLSELENLLLGLGLTSRVGGYHILGHSWGGMLASMHAATSPPELRKLVLCSSPASMKLFLEASDKLREQLPPPTQEVLLRHEKAGTTDSKEYEEAVGVFYKKHLCRIDPMPEEFQRSMEWIEKDPTVYHTMYVFPHLNRPHELRRVSYWSHAGMVHPSSTL